MVVAEDEEGTGNVGKVMPWEGSSETETGQSWRIK